MPSSSSFFDTAPGQPFLSLFFYLDRQILTDLMLRMRPAGKAPQEDGPGVAVADAEPEFLEAVLRLAELLDKPEQIAIRAPMILQELHYLLLIGPLGHVLRGLYAQGSQNSQVLQAVSILRRDLGAPVRMESLARQVPVHAPSPFQDRHRPEPPAIPQAAQAPRGPAPDAHGRHARGLGGPFRGL